ncbi:NAD-dependent epimerase/dehydratase family protein [Halomarina oriensis]|uniref:NAD-dependent epimerase/dehydratase family protein n=1 Tax=Halomarina oriensis TaxID=671145 RepID=A0A6B0GMX2_9EURY|nr:NAD(P)-dependent oxidoreductase [Halomarina oriensis]MWG33475.1 NAD-dependent epimerase/dehydratase family protein [Halomarina oriensis]
MSDQSDVVAVTGGLGGVGRWVVDRFARDGDEVVCIDRHTPTEAAGNVRFFAADLTDAGETFDLLADVDPDAVVHIAAIPDPTEHAGVRVFENNTLSTYNVLTAAGRVGARVSWASSESAYGFPFSGELLLPEYLPIDESHPMRPEDPYGTSKEAGEAVAKAVTRKYGVQVASIRPSWVQYPGEYLAATNRVDIDDVEPGTKVPGAGNFWSYVDVRDLADLFVRSVRTTVDGHEAYHGHAADNYVGVETERLFEAVTGGDLPTPCDLSGEESAFSIEKAAAELGWTPEHSWREAEDESVEGPSFG